jgi:hypothetical protein
MKKLWAYSIESAKNGKAISAIFALFTWLLVIALASSFFVTPKPWYTQFFYALTGIISGGVAGLILGFIIGGIGIAFAGIAIGIAGWIAGAVFGSMLGGLFGLLISFFTNPSAFNFHFFKFTLVAVIAFGAAVLVFKVIHKLFLFLKGILFGRKDNFLKKPE